MSVPEFVMIEQEIERKIEDFRDLGIQEKDLHRDGIFVKAIPAWKWLLNDWELAKAMKYKSIYKSGVDKTLIAMFLKMSIEERLAANDNAVRTIQELRDAFERKQSRRNRTERTFK